MCVAGCWSGRSSLGMSVSICEIWSLSSPVYVSECDHSLTNYLVIVTLVHCVGLRVCVSAVVCVSGNVRKCFRHLNANI